MKHCVIGSINMDLVTTLDRFPEAGETVTGIDFKTSPGGKGANQAVALARLGSDVVLVGNVGMDGFGDQYLEHLAAENVDSSCIERLAGTSTGIAVIEVETSSENRIVVIPGANGRLTPESAKSRASLVAAADIFLLQLEIPLETVAWILENRRPRGIYILDPAPARKIPDELFSKVDCITPNETELGILAGLQVRNEKDVREGAERLLAKGVKTVIVKAGEKGAYLVRSEGMIRVPGFKVEPVDTTGAGDTFNAAFAHALGKGGDAEGAVRFACAAAAISTTKFGAQGAMPGEKEVLELLG